LELVKVEQALRSEKMKMEYRKANKPDDINILDYTVIAALEKQIPKEPVMGSEVLNAATDKPYKVPSCPACGEPTYSLEWCAFCGQRLVKTMSEEEVEFYLKESNECGNDEPCIKCRDYEKCSACLNK
jgi:predicted nucleic-acid-binding Zn-ribbon protein